MSWRVRNKHGQHKGYQGEYTRAVQITEIMADNGMTTRNYYMVGRAKFAAVDTEDGIIIRTSPEYEKILLGQKFLVAKVLARRLNLEIRTVQPFVCKGRLCRKKKKLLRLRVWT